MKHTFSILLFLLSLGFLHSQDYKVYEIDYSKDLLRKKLVKEVIFDKQERIKLETFYNYKPFGSQWNKSGQTEYEYENERLVEVLFNDPGSGDTIRTTYKYKGNKVLILQEELVEESKLKKGLVYGDGTPNGCIVPPEALEYYKKWVTRLKKKVIFNKGKKEKEFILFSYRTNSYNLEYKYDNRGRLIEEVSIGRKTEALNWKRQYSYKGDSIQIEREFFITYWDKIPPTEKETKILDKEGRIIEILMSNMKDKEDCKILKEFRSNGNLIEEKLYTPDGELKRKHVYEYQ